MKKIFEQPELMVVQMNNHDIVTESIAASSTDYDGKVYAPGRDFDEF